VGVGGSVAGSEGQQPVWGTRRTTASDVRFCRQKNGDRVADRVTRRSHATEGADMRCRTQPHPWPREAALYGTACVLAGGWNTLYFVSHDKRFFLHNITIGLHGDADKCVTTKGR